MFTFDLLAQIYLISFLVGSVYIVFNFLLGQIDHASSEHHGIHLLGGDHSAGAHDASLGHHSSGSHNLSHDISHSADHGHLASHHSAHLDDPTSQPQSGLPNFLSVDIAAKLRRRLQILVQSEDISSSIGMFIISLLSPMRIAIWLTFFGLSGFFIYRLLPWLSIISLIPAVVIAFVCSKIFNLLICWAMNVMQSPPAHKLDDLIGTVAEVYTPMTYSQLGEIVYNFDCVRSNCSAKAKDEGMEFLRGQRVMIIGLQNHVAIVEPISDPLLLQDSKS